jgi:glucose/arabinose dehydrogenase
VRSAALRHSALAIGVVAMTGIAGIAVSMSAQAASDVESIAIERVVGGLRAPVDIGAPASEPERLYIVEQRGLIRTLVRGKLLARPFLDIRRLVRAKQLSGLFSVAFDPNYGRTRLFVVAYVGRDFDLHVVRYRSRAGVAIPSSAHELLHVEMPTDDTDNHFGGDLAFGPDARLYIGVGDAQIPAMAQDPDSLLGKLIRLDARTESPVPEVVALGLRNPWRFSFDRATGDLYIGDVGASSWEEINYVARGSVTPVNFGWPAYEGRERISTPSAPLDPSPTAPLFVYPHASKGCSSVVGGYVYRGRRIPALRGRYLFGDFCSAEIRSLQVVAGKPRKLRTELSRRLPGLLSSFGEDSRGELYAFAYTYKLSELYRLEPTRP